MRRHVCSINNWFIGYLSKLRTASSGRSSIGCASVVVDDGLGGKVSGFSGLSYTYPWLISLLIGASGSTAAGSRTLGPSVGNGGRFFTFSKSISDSESRSPAAWQLSANNRKLIAKSVSNSTNFRLTMENRCPDQDDKHNLYSHLVAGSMSRVQTSIRH